MGKTIFYIRSATVNLKQCQKQENALRAYADEHGITDYTIMRDCGYSNHTPELVGPMFKKLTKAILAGEVSQVVVYSTDRITRSFEKYCEFQKLCKAHNVELISVILGGEVTIRNMYELMERFCHGQE